MTIKVGDYVRFREGSYFHGKGDRFVGRVVKVAEGTSDEDHGAIDVILTECENYYLDVGEIENFVHYNWKKHLEIVEEK